MQVGAHVWNGDKCGVVLSSDESGVTVGYFADVETLTSDADNPSPLSSSPAVEPADVTADTGTPEPPAPAAKPTDTAQAENADPLAALTADEQATYKRLQGKIDGAGA